jgi:hypothetical protein
MVKEDLDVAIVLLNLVDNDRQWFKSNQCWFCPAPKVDETGRDISFCGRTILNDAHDVVVVENTLEDDRFADNPFVSGPFALIFDAGCTVT